MSMIFNDREINSRLDEELEILSHCEAQYVAEPSSFIDDVIQLCEHGDEQSGAELPWQKVDKIFRVRPGELTLWAGINGHGKSLAVGQAVTKFIRDGQKALVASLEMKPSETLYRMARQVAHCTPARDYARDIIGGWDGGLWIYDQLDTVESDRILALVHYAAKDLKVDHVVIDSLLKCGIGYEDYSAETKFVNRLQWAAKAHKIHIHLVCHMRKGQDENKKLSKFDVRGAGAIGDIADNIIIVQRNKQREEVARKQNRINSLQTHEGETKCLSDKELEILLQASTRISVEKNRHGGQEGAVGLWFHEMSMQLTDYEGRPIGKQP